MGIDQLMSNEQVSGMSGATGPHGRGGALEQVLRGKRVIELSGGLAGQHCGYTLDGLGASVVTIKRVKPGSAGAAPSPLDRHKRIVELNPKTQEGFDALLALCADCDLFIEDRPPLGWPGGQPTFTRLMERHPLMLVVCLSPFGLTGPHADFAAYPLNCYHSGGNAQQIPCDLLRPQDNTRSPLQAGGHWGEAQAGTLAAATALACLLHPQSHAGRVIDCSKQEALISYNWTETARFPNEGCAPTRLAPLATIVGGLLPTLDGFVQIAVREDHQWQALAQLLGHPEWRDDVLWSTRAARIGRAAEVSRLLADETVKFPTQHLHLRGRELGIPIAAVLSPSQLLADADLAARQAWSEADSGGVKLPRWGASINTWDADASPRERTVAGVKSDVPALDALGRLKRPLEGLRVLDFGWVAMGPYAGYTLAGLGAQVIHIARPAQTAAAGVDLSAYNYGFDTLNTGKTWVGVDLQSSAGRELIHALAARCDIVLDNFRPGVTQRLGIDFKTLSAINPRLVMMSASTYGERGIGGPYVGYAPVFSALAGLAHFTGYPDGPPAEVSHPVDFYAGSVGVLGLIAGLHRLAATGAGCHIDLSAREAVMWSLSHDLARVQEGQTEIERLGNTHPDMAPHGVYRCRGENRWISIAVGNDDEWQRLCACIGDDQLTRDTRFNTTSGRLAHRALIDRQLEQWTQDKEMGWVFGHLQASKVAAFPSSTSEDLWNDAQLKARQIFMSRQSAASTRWYVGMPWNYLGEPRLPLNTVDGSQATRSVFAELLGLSQGQIEALKAKGVIAIR